MFIWFVGLSLVVVWAVFQDPAIDYRLVAAGAVGPVVIDGAFGGARLLHTAVFSIVLLAAVMIATQSRRRMRRRLLAIPIGTFLHLVLDGTWARVDTFWWPVFGTSLAESLPETDRPFWAVLAMEVAGLAALLWFRARFRLDDPVRFRQFLRTGRLGRDFRPGATPSC